MSEDNLKEIPKPIGKFISENKKGVQLNDGTYYHYADVVDLIKTRESQSDKKLVDKIALEKLIDWCYDITDESNSDRLYELLERLE